MHKNATKCNETLSKWCKNKHGATKIVDTFETYQPVYFLFLINFLSLLQKFSFQDLENSRIIIAPDRIVPDPEDPDHEDKMPKNTRATSAMGKASFSRHSIQDWSDDNSDGECRMYLDPMPLAYAFPTMPSSAISDNKVVDAGPLNQGPPPGPCVGRKCGVKP
jgi:hypothetical protein